MSIFSVNVKISKLDFMTLLISYSSITICSNLLMGLIIGQITEEAWAYAAFYFSIAFSALVVSFFINKLAFFKLIYIWSLITPTALVSLVYALNTIFILVSICILGASFGAALLAIFNFFYDITTYEERGRVGGLIVFLTFIFLQFFMVLGQYLGFFGVITLSILLSISTLTIKLMSPEKKVKKKYVAHHSNRTFLFYLSPWLIFSLINGVLAKIWSSLLLQEFPEIAFQMTIIQFFALCVGAIIGGLSADWIGRKAALILGISLYGIHTALSGLAKTMGVVYFVFFSNGLAFGISFLMYFLVVWGELKSGEHRSPYAAGIFPFFFSLGLANLLPPIVQVSASSIALLSSIVIFFSIFPIVFAPELMPPDIRKEMDWRLYLEKIKGMVRRSP